MVQTQMPWVDGIARCLNCGHAGQAHHIFAMREEHRLGEVTDCDTEGCGCNIYKADLPPKVIMMNAVSKYPVCAVCGHNAEEHYDPQGVGEVPGEGAPYPCQHVGELNRSCECLGYATQTEKDVVNHPAHYTRGKIEVWDFIMAQDIDFLRANAVKYISRAGAKDPSMEIQDLDKAIAYINREIRGLRSDEIMWDMPNRSTNPKISVEQFIADQNLNWFKGNALALVCGWAESDSLAIDQLESAIEQLNREKERIKEIN